MSLILVMGFCISAVPGTLSAEDTTWDAQCMLGKQSTLKNASVYGAVTERVLPAVEKGGRQAWEVQPASWYNNSAYVDVKNGLLEKRRDTLVEYLFLLLCGAVLISSDSAAVVAAATSAALRAAVA